MKDTVNRASRDRRVLALLAWAVLIVTAFNLWNSRLTDSILLATPEPIAFILAAFGAFVGVFAWMLFNPGRQSAAESPELFFAAIATLFPPPVIAFCLMPPTSPLRWWLAIGIFALCVIAVLSHVPDEFFAVPRNRATYLTPIPTFDKVYDGVMDPHAEWFTFQDLSRVVPDADRPSLAPRAYLQLEPDKPATTTVAAPRKLMPVSDVDDILGPNFDEDLFADDLLQDVDLPQRDRRDEAPNRPAVVGPQQRRRPEPQLREAQPTPTINRPRPVQTKPSGPPIYSIRNPERRTSHVEALHRPRRVTQFTRRTKQERLAESIRIDHSADLRSLEPAPKPGSKPSNQPQNFVSDAALKTASSAKTPTSIEKSRSKRSSRSDSGTNVAIQRTDRSETLQSRDTTSVRVDERAKPPGPQTSTISQTSTAPATDSSPRSEAREESYRRKDRRTASANSPTLDSSRNVATAAGIAATTAAGAASLASTQDTTSAPVERLTKPVERSASKTQPSETRRGRRALPDLERVQDEHGGELIEGVMTVRFEKDQKRANLHVPFSPPLAGMPEVECECVDGENIRLKVPVKQSYGIRIEARRSDASEPLEADISFAAVYTPE